MLAAKTPQSPHRPSLTAVAEPETEVERARVQPPGHLLESVECREDGPCLAEQALTGIGELDAATGSFEQGQLELRLELANALRQRGRRHVQPRRGPAEMTLLGHRHEVSEPPQVDVRHAGTLATPKP